MSTRCVACDAELGTSYDEVNVSYCDVCTLASDEVLEEMLEEAVKEGDITTDDYLAWIKSPSDDVVE